MYEKYAPVLNTQLPLTRSDWCHYCVTAYSGSNCSTTMPYNTLHTLSTLRKVFYVLVHLHISIWRTCYVQSGWRRRRIRTCEDLQASKHYYEHSYCAGLMLYYTIYDTRSNGITRIFDECMFRIPTRVRCRQTIYTRIRISSKSLNSNNCIM